MSPLYCALVHFPVLDRDGTPTTSAITNLDIHDISRIARTYDLKGYFIVSPIPAQLKLAERILEHWQCGAGKRRMPERSEALLLCKPLSTLQEVNEHIKILEGRHPRIVATTAKTGHDPSHLTTFRKEAMNLVTSSEPVLLLFGTGHGLDDSVVRNADAWLEPIRGRREYNHLSVRAAVAIIVDRLYCAVSLLEEQDG